MIPRLLRRSGCLALVAVLIGSIAWAQSRGTSEDESAIRALLETQSPERYAADADWTNAFGNRLHGREEIAKFFDKLHHDPNFTAGKATPSTDKSDVRFVRPDVAVVYEYIERVGQIDPTVNKPMPTRKIHVQYVLSKEDGKWLIQSELIMDEEHYAKEK
jgi:uncharacterized protein (TIGR02246 family)